MSKITFQATEGDGDDMVVITRIFEAEHIEKILEEFMYFLWGLTFNWVEDVVATTSHGVEWSATPVIGEDEDEYSDQPYVDLPAYEGDSGDECEICNALEPEDRDPDCNATNPFAWSPGPTEPQGC